MLVKRVIKNGHSRAIHYCPAMASRLGIGTLQIVTFCKYDGGFLLHNNHKLPDDWVRLIGGHNYINLPHDIWEGLGLDVGDGLELEWIDGAYHLGKSSVNHWGN
jgi:hypothetical protein